MNKCFIFFSLLLGTAVTVSAQTNVQYGAKAGVTLSTISKTAEPLITPKPVAGFYLGGLARINVHENIAIQPELLLSAQGYNDDYKSRYGSQYTGLNSIRNTLYYLNLPVSVRYAVTDFLFIEAGPQVGYQLSSSSKFNYASEDEPMPGEDGVLASLMSNGIPQQGGGGATDPVPALSGGLNRFDIGLTIGGEYLITSNWGGHIRYVHGLSDAQKGDFLQVKSRVLMLGISYLIGK